MRRQNSRSTDDLLPGVTDLRSRPSRASVNSVREVRQARRQVITRESIDALLILAVDIFFIQWQQARLPFVSRETSTLLLLAVNVMLASYWVALHYAPTWKAKRIAATWSRDEQKRFQIR